MSTHTNQTLALSTEIYAIPLQHNSYVIYAPLEKAAFVGDAGAVSSLKRLQQGRWSPRSEQDHAFVEFLRRLSMVGGQQSHTPEERRHGAPEPTEITLFLTTVCNLRCSYCYASAGDTPSEFMDLSVAQRGIDFIVKNARRTESGAISVGYHGGGEPTLNWGVLTGSWEYAAAKAERHGLMLRTYTATNGVLTNAKIAWIVAHLDGASVSFDGLPSVQDAHRPLASGRGSHAQLDASLRAFDRAGFNYQLRITVTSELLPHLLRSVRYICDNYAATGIHLEPVYQEGRGTDLSRINTQQFIDSFIEAYALAESYGRRVHYSAARAGVLTNHFCGVSRDSFGLSAKGSVSACYEAFSETSEHAGEFIYGRLANDGLSGFQFDMAALDGLRNRTVNNRRYCQGCFAKWSCAGDCAVKHLDYAKHGYCEEPPRCRITRELTLHQIVQKIEEGGGLFWHEPVS